MIEEVIAEKIQLAIKVLVSLANTVVESDILDEEEAEMIKRAAQLVSKVKINCAQVNFIDEKRLN